MTKRVFRFVPFTIIQDETAEPEYSARCVSGDEAECGAESGARLTPGDVEEWQRQHTQNTRHVRYHRVFADYAVIEAPAGLPVTPKAPECRHVQAPGSELHLNGAVVVDAAKTVRIRSKEPGRA